MKNNLQGLKNITTLADLENNALGSLLGAVNSRKIIPAFDVDNTLSLANKGFAVFEYILRNNQDKIDENDDEQILGTLNRGMNKEYFELNLKQIALNYPNHKEIIDELQKSIASIAESEPPTSPWDTKCIINNFKTFVSALRNKVIALRKDNKKVPDDLFIAPLAKEFLNQVKEGNQDKIIIASIAFCNFDEAAAKNALKLIYEKAFGKNPHCSIYVPFSGSPSWHKFTPEEFSNLKLNLKVGSSVMQKATDLSSLLKKLKKESPINDKKILHIDNESCYKLPRYKEIEFLHFTHKQIKELTLITKRKGKLTNQEMPDDNYTNAILEKLQTITGEKNSSPENVQEDAQEGEINQINTINTYKFNENKTYQEPKNNIELGNQESNIPNSDIKLDNQDRSKNCFTRLLDDVGTFFSC